MILMHVSLRPPAGWDREQVHADVLRADRLFGYALEIAEALLAGVAGAAGADDTAFCSRGLGHCTAFSCFSLASLPGKLAGIVDCADATSVQSLFQTASASRIRFVIASGCEMSARWLASISIVFAPIRLAMKRSRSGLIVRSCVDTA